MMFIFKNPIKQNRKKQDAIIRALAIAENRSWEEVYKDICRVAFEICNNPQFFEVWKYYLMGKYPGKYRAYPKARGKARMSINHFAADHPQGTYILFLINEYVTCLIDGNQYDVEDMTNKTVLASWEITPVKGFGKNQQGGY